MTPISPVLRRNIMTLARAYAKARNIHLGTVSRMIRGDMYFLDSLSKNKIGVTSWKYDEILQWFEKNWPENTPMPKIEEFTK